MLCVATPDTKPYPDYTNFEEELMENFLESHNVYKDVLLKMVSIDPDKRPKAAELVSIFEAHCP